jgi:hypothetical protein
VQVTKQKALPRPLTNIPRGSKDGSLRASSDINDLTLWLKEELKKVFMYTYSIYLNCYFLNEFNFREVVGKVEV